MAEWQPDLPVFGDLPLEPQVSKVSGTHCFAGPLLVFREGTVFPLVDEWLAMNENAGAKGLLAAMMGTGLRARLVVKDEAVETGQPGAPADLFVYGRLILYPPDADKGTAGYAILMADANEITARKQLTVRRVEGGAWVPAVLLREDGLVSVGGQNSVGRVEVLSGKNAKRVLVLDSSNSLNYKVPCQLLVRSGAGGNGSESKSDDVLRFYAADARLCVGRRDGNIPGVVELLDADGKNSVVLDGAAGDITLNGADCAEEFEVGGEATVEPGMVVVADRCGRVRPCRKAGDKRVVGVVSGGGGLRPGVVLNKMSSSRNRVPIALAGKVYCRVDCSFGAVRVGDLLTSSPTPGHAMRATGRAVRGAVIGKALQKVGDGREEVLMLVMPG